ncbi:MAG: tRNA (adenosine(37)-N6)-threonylcarbamoyltransferase complex transferase subunit TsaD [Verrucomicrobia bacterium]|nr:tRNA (adenosine(37)-N6)-threonylcarbamoyltransferase complex transferase subunit TsaD [Verrucomicrobiota bacterium]MCG2681725.1 tRNA (adenosine(37)-N6)-threonylcarbamoyltransferase complex transferase subunit TsaD [Kiritimatiellia bacterium]MBU4247186.1 tRNA (adenosine(37)-N6)-threonylcarbamoyltransferase complex transferase subunit TsaD [Verrucomicrobiota bacterium]MBU4291405.1 tRNA (adenosine(37)-N6)-threonylcarbamoyltransferase complex transferase subunit TsaD [Verrucomicrobiota bacterium]
MNVLGIETSCDETAAAVVADGRTVLASVVFSQIPLHQPYGGVVPEIASRNHLTHLPRVIESALDQAGLTWAQIDAVAVTYGPGLASSLLVGLSTAKALAMRLQVPLVGINHLEAHVYSPMLSPDGPEFQAVCPLVALMVSGGHTCLVRADGPGRYRRLGWTLDDAAGEAFDKGANLLGLGYPGGPAIDRASEGGDPCYIRFPRGQTHKSAHVSPQASDLCFSFSGLKTALLYYLKAHPCLPGSPPSLASIAASYQEAIVDALVERLRLAVNHEQVKRMAAVGGVSLNRRLREKLKQLAASLKVELLLSQPEYCVDNAAMVAGLAGIGQGISGAAALELDAMPNLEIGR